MATSRPPLQVLILADERDTTDLLIRELTRCGFDVEATVVGGAREFRDELAHDHHLILAHHGLPGLDAFEALGMLRSTEHDIPFVAFGGSMSQQELAECLRLGASAHVPEDELGHLGETVQRVLDDREVPGASEPVPPAELRAELSSPTAPTSGESAASGDSDRVALLEARVEQLLALRRVDRALAAATDLRVALATAAAEVLAVTAAGAISVWVYEEAGRTLSRYSLRRAGAGSSEAEQGLQATVNLGEGTVGRCALSRKPLSLVGSDTIANESGGRMEGEWQEYAAYPMELEGRLQGVLEVFGDHAGLLAGHGLEFVEEVAASAAAATERTRRFRELERAVSGLAASCDATIEVWARALDMRDDETEGHSRRVTDVTVALARHMGMEGEELAHTRRGALLHDIGKLGVADSIFTKPGALTSSEREDMQRHPELAKELLAEVAFLEPALAIPWCHHENWDGSGYPRGLRGEEIPLPARIFAVADVYDALTSARPYRSAWTDDAARRFIEERSGRQFDPRVVDAFLEVLPALSVLRR